MINKKIIIPLILLSGTLFAFIISSMFLTRKPVIDSISPEVGNPGDIIVIEGKYFGDLRNGGEINLAGIRPVSDSYRLWSDERIEVYLPVKLQSGMISVVTREGVSNGLLFTNRQHIPVILDGPGQGLPDIESISPSKGSTGSKITIKGLNFGLEQASGLAFFTPENSIQSRSSPETSEIMIPATERDYDYILWTDNEIVLYVPDGAVSGNVKIWTEKGTSDGYFFEVKGQVGNRVFTSSKTYEIDYGVTISEVIAAVPNYLDIMLPRPAETIFQKTLLLKYSTEPLWENYKNLMRFRFTDMKSWRNYDIRVTATLVRYAYESRIESSRVPAEYNTERKLYSVYTSADKYLPADNSAFRNLGREFLKNNRSNPYRRARKIYDYIIKKMDFTGNNESKELISMYNAGKGNSFAYSAAFCCISRNAGIPSRLISGIFAVPQQPIKNHYWSEIYIEKYGWLPVDTVMGDGAIFDMESRIDNANDFYFGNMDNRHVLMSRGVTEIKKLSPQASADFDLDSYSLQTIHKETYGDISQHSVKWKDFFVNASW